MEPATNSNTGVQEYSTLSDAQRRIYFLEGACERLQQRVSELLEANIRLTGEVKELRRAQDGE